jgi:S1-C subfamily serine protease
MLPESFLKNDELVQELLETDALEKSRTRQRANIEAKKIKGYLKVLTEKGVNQAERLLTPEEKILVEAVIEIKERPALLIQNNKFEEPKTNFWKTLLEPYRVTIEKAITSVGRIEVINHPNYQWIGTGWLVAEDIIVTNRHVAQEFAYQERGKFVFQKNPFTERAIRVEIDFREEVRIDEEEEFEIESVLYIEGQEGLDIAFLKVKSNNAASRSIILLADKLPEIESEVVVIGYPAQDSQRNPLEPAKLKEIFGAIYDVKRLQPGKVKSAIVDNPIFTHDCSTLGGNSGSVVLDYKTGKAVGLHFGGKFKEANYAVSSIVIKQRLDALRSGTLGRSSISENPSIVVPNQIIETVDNETPIELEDTPCLCPLNDESLEELILEAVPFPSVNVQLPKSGTGYYSYAQFREKQFGLAQTIKAIERIALAWFQNHRTGPLIGVGNISKNGGGSVPPHSSHQTGLDVDFRLLRKDGARIGVTFRDPNYSLDRTQELVNTILRNSVLSVVLILCNDDKLKGVQPWPGHDDHLHVRFKK